jgi:hypothetical protein
MDSSADGEGSTTPRKENISVRDLSRFFHLPIAAASKELGICATALKKICRRHRVTRWPHRKLKSLERAIGMIEEQIQNDPTCISKVEERLAELRRDKAELMIHPERSSMKSARGSRTELHSRFPLACQEVDDITTSEEDATNESLYSEPYSPPTPPQVPLFTMGMFSTPPMRLANVQYPIQPFGYNFSIPQC